MSERILHMALTFVFKRIMRHELRHRGIRAVRAYVQAIAKVRAGTMAIVGVIACVALSVVGFTLFLGAILWMLPVTAVAMAWIVLLIGLIFTAPGVAVLYYLFSQRRWLEVSRTYELMDVTIGRRSVAANPRGTSRSRAVSREAPQEATPRTTARKEPQTLRPIEV